MKKIILFIIALLNFSSIIIAQTGRISGIVRDAETKAALPFVTVTLKHSKQVTLTDSAGKFTFKNILPNNYQSLQFSMLAHVIKDTIVQLIADSLFVEIELKPEEKRLEDVIIVSSLRTNTRIEDLPTKVEVLGSEEVGEENQIKPGNIAGLLGDFAGIQIQQTNVATGSADMRIQGLQGKYTQLLQDGVPLFGGYSGGFSILQIPPLYLQQIEMVKGSSSTLYGGGAIAGMVNLVSKKPKLNSPETCITLNRSTLKENNANAFFSGRNKTIGYTLFAGGTLQNAVDVNSDGFSDVPDLKSIFIHPKIFFYPSPSSTLTAGYTFDDENRKGGDMTVLNNQPDDGGQFFIQNKTLRNTVDATWEQRLQQNATLTVKGSSSLFNRNIATNVFGMNANETLWYSEASYAQKIKKHSWVAGINFNGDNFKKQHPDSSYMPDENGNSTGVFVQDDWMLMPKITLQAGLRFDHHSVYGNYFLPHISFMYKMNNHLTLRMGGGLGYQTPNLFNDDELDERNYHYLKGYAPNIQSEKSAGANFDINYKTKLNDWNITYNLTFFYNHISRPMLLEYTPQFSGGYYQYYNAPQPLQTIGTETFVHAREDDWELYFGYVYTNAKRKYNAANTNLPLIARNKLATLVTYELSEKFKVGFELSYIDKQYLDNGNTTIPYVIGAAMINYKVKKISFVLNCENLFDFRQSKHEPVVFPPSTNPSFSEIWAPLEGRVANLSIMLQL